MLTWSSVVPSGNRSVFSHWHRPLSLLLPLLLLFFIPVKGEAETWRQLRQGLEFAQFPLDDNEQAITIVRIDPQHVFFELCTTSDGRSNHPLSLAQWSKERDLDVAINASMYLPDNRTSTGYLRHGTTVNNPRVSSKFGAFFVADPLQTSLPSASILERESHDVKTILSGYNLVIQNYRLISSSRQILWSKNKPRHTTAAVGIDGKGMVLFVYSAIPASPYALAETLLNLPIDIRTTMYVEGGIQAGLYIRELARSFPNEEELGSFFSLVPKLPNVLGVRLRKEASEKP